MNDLMRAFGISACILLLVVVFTVVITFVTVKRGEASVGAAEHDVPDVTPAAKETAAASPAKGAKPGAAAAEQISVIQILLFGLGLFVLTILALLGLSLVQHML